MAVASACGKRTGTSQGTGCHAWVPRLLSFTSCLVPCVVDPQNALACLYWSPLPCRAEVHGQPGSCYLRSPHAPSHSAADCTPWLLRATVRRWRSRSEMSLSS
jgi:hypothetical protein